jgi:GNAT superfamily N-acetyltransferase
MSRLSSLRSTIVRHLPPRVRVAIRRRINQARWLEAQVRKILPTAAGGRIPASKLTARVLQPEDAIDLLRLTDTPLEPEQLQTCQANLAREDRFAIGVFAEGRLVARGWCGELFASLGLPGQWAFSDFVRPELRYRGVGQLLHRARLAEARRRGISPVYIFMSEINDPSLGACQAAGFVKLHAPDWSKAIEDSMVRDGLPPTKQLVLVHRG